MLVRKKKNQNHCHKEHYITLWDMDEEGVLLCCIFVCLCIDTHIHTYRERAGEWKEGEEGEEKRKEEGKRDSAKENFRGLISPSNPHNLRYF